MAVKLKPVLSIPLLVLFLLHCTFLSDATNPDALPLLLFKSTVDPSNTILTTWNATSDPCNSAWFGVSCLHNRVSRLVLENLSLRGPLPLPITFLTNLRVISLKKNSFLGPIPDLSNLTSLKFLYVSHNKFSGDFPVSVASLRKLYRLDLSYNNLSGNIPVSLNHLTHLLTLRLEENGLTGPIVGLGLPNLQDFNVSGNGLTGEIPGSLSGFPISAFWNNSFLCGAPMEKCKKTSNAPLSRNTTVPPSPIAMPLETKPPAKSENSKRNKTSWLAITTIILGDVLALGIVSLILYCYFCRNYSKRMSEKTDSHVEKLIYSSNPYPSRSSSGRGFERGKMVFFDGERRFELEDLLRASAEMLGKGGFGTAYKAVMDDGNVVAVKRLKDLNMNGRKEFEQQMEVLGRLRHPNIVSLKAYCFAKDEKLLVHEYMPNGNLFWLLHGNRGPGRTPLDWTTRLRIAGGAARGLDFIHNSNKSSPGLVHGNIKSTNILIDKAGNARVSDYGLSVFMSPSSVPKSNGYRAPETVIDGRKLTRRSDIYSFGVLLLELLTGKCPSVVDNGVPGSGSNGVLDLPKWVQSVVREEWTAEVFDLELMRYKDIEEEMVGLLQIAMACTQTSPDHRPKMNYIVKMIDELRGTETLNSISDSPVCEDKSRASV
ncbi:unnamed protein product [Fraxinus pennsylvanica]|uniref:Protein kinase domain-containing protein n=1 Tax=Fraxinus pennsylvanica TaxID=56036 RepID=A0AAD2EDI6_9LAMI|nr:unnamed protein product [Fraxinus pennsylvanica]